MFGLSFSDRKLLFGHCDDALGKTCLNLVIMFKLLWRRYQAKKLSLELLSGEADVLWRKKPFFSDCLRVLRRHFELMLFFSAS